MRFVYIVLFLSFSFFGYGFDTHDNQNETITKEVKSDSLNGELGEFSQEFEIEEIYDPFNTYNRLMTEVNDVAYEYILKPVAKGYKKILHVEARECVRNFFNNLYYPTRVVNNLLQGKFCYAYEETSRFVINSTIGILGLFDPAKSKFELQPHEEDFGQTLGFYGVGGGPHIVLPLLGPSNLRDALSLYPDSLLSPIDYTDRSYSTLTDNALEYLGVKVIEKVNYISLNMDEYEKMKKDAVDLYPYLRDIYEQYREKQIKE